MRPGSEDEVARAVVSAGPRGVIARGQGRSYGDAAINAGGSVLDTGQLTGISIEGNTVRVGAGTRLDTLIECLLAHGLFVPVTPGTRFVTAGGLIAADVHGKNHHASGSWGHHTRALRLIDGTGVVRDLTPDGPTSAEFWATVGGMGLTGVITEVTFSAIPVKSNAVLVNNQRYPALDEVMLALEEADATSTYSVAWLDAVGLAGSLGRGIVSTGRHADDGVTASTPPKPRLAVPWRPRFNAISRPAIGAANNAWYLWSGRPQRDKKTSLWSYFYPLDGIADWNRAYGTRGFVQYQFVVPDHARSVIATALATLRNSGCPSSLVVLKRFGEGNPGPLSFPMPGWTLALDIPVTSALGRVLDTLDTTVEEAGGRHYLAKDARMSRRAMRAGYPRLHDWLRVRDRLDPERAFQSDLGRRLDLITHG